MRRIAVLNILLGFCCILLAASAGAFLSLEITHSFVSDPEWLSSWNLTLLRSAHNHFNQFGYLMVLFGLSLPYSRIPDRFLVWQSSGLWLGAVAMGPGMVLKAYEAPSKEEGLLTYVIGLFLSLALAAIALHVLGILSKWMRTN